MSLNLTTKCWNHQLHSMLASFPDPLPFGGMMNSGYSRSTFLQICILLFFHLVFFLHLLSNRIQLRFRWRQSITDYFLEALLEVLLKFFETLSDYLFQIFSKLLCFYSFFLFFFFVGLKLKISGLISQELSNIFFMPSPNTSSLYL